MATIDQQFVEYIVKSLVGNPDDVQVERTIDEKGVLLTLTSTPKTLGESSVNVVRRRRACGRCCGHSAPKMMRVITSRSSTTMTIAKTILSHQMTAPTRLWTSLTLKLWKMTQAKSQITQKSLAKSLRNSTTSIYNKHKFNNT